MSDLISRQAAIDAPERFIKDCNPEHFVGHQKFIEYIDNAEIGSFGNWQFANGFNMGLTATEVAIKELPSAQPEIIRCKDCRHRDPEDHKCDSGETERQGCPFKVADDYFCAYGERRSE